MTSHWDHNDGAEALSESCKGPGKNYSDWVKDALYGSLDPNTREWTDGLFTHILRK